MTCEETYPRSHSSDPVKLGSVGAMIAIRFRKWRLEWQGNPNPTVGKLERKDDRTVVAYFVTKDGSIVDRFVAQCQPGGLRRSYLRKHLFKPFANREAKNCSSRSGKFMRR